MGGEIELDMDAAEKALNRFFQTGGGYMPALCAAIRAYLAAAQPERRGAEAMRERAAEVVDCGCDARAAVLGAPYAKAASRMCPHPPCGALEAQGIRALPLPGDKEPTP